MSPRSARLEPARSDDVSGGDGAAAETSLCRSREPKWRIWIWVAVLVASTAAVYSNSFGDGFPGADAKESIRDNPHIRRLWPLSEAMSLPLLQSTAAADVDSKGGTVVRRPILSLSFALTHHLFGPRARGYHGVNLAIHLAAGLLLFGSIRRTLLLPRWRVPVSRATALAGAISLLWLLHPLQTESVTNLVQRAESQMGMFVLLTLYCGIRGFTAPEPRWWYAAAVGSSALAMGTKESAVAAPLLVLLYDYIFVSTSLAACMRRRGVYIALAATWLVLLALVAMTFGDTAKDLTGGGNLAYALAQPGVILHYLKLALWPRELFVYVGTSAYDAHSLLEAAPAAIAMAALLAVTLWGIAGRRWFGFLGGAFFLLLAPTSSLVATSDVIQEHRMYLPLALVITAAVFGGDWVLQAAVRPRRRQLAAAIAVGVCALFLGARTHARNRDYAGEFGMIYPADLDEEYMILTQHYLQRQNWRLGRRQAQTSLAAADARERTFGHFLRGRMAAESGNLQVAASELEETLRLHPDFAYAQKELGSVRLQQGQLEDAAQHCERALALKRDFPEAHYELGMVLMQQDRIDAAIEHFETAVRLWPGFAEAHYELGMALRRRGAAAAGAEHLQQAVRLRPEFEEARQELQRGR